MVATGITSYWVQSVMGVIIIIAVVINVSLGEGHFGEVVRSTSTDGSSRFHAATLTERAKGGDYAKLK